MIQFDEASHTYWDGGTQLPSVTQILKPLYGDLRFVGSDLLEYKSELGKAVHKAVELHVLDYLDYGSLDPVVAEYFSQYLRFETDTGFKATGSEIIVHHSLGYAGTLDLAGNLGAFHCNIDLKTTSALSKAVALQLAGYKAAYVEMGGIQQPVRRYALRLTPNSYHLEPYNPARDSIDFASFVGFLKVHQWCATNGIEFTMEKDNG